MPRKENQGNEATPLPKDKKIFKAAKSGAQPCVEKQKQDKQMIGDPIIKNDAIEKAEPDIRDEDNPVPKQAESARDIVDEVINSENLPGEPDSEPIDAEGGQNQQAPQNENQQLYQAGNSASGERMDGALRDFSSESQNQHQEYPQNDLEGQSNSNLGPSKPIIPAINTIQFQKDSIQGDSKMHDKSMAEMQVNKYLGFKPNKHREDGTNIKGKGKKGKKRVISDSDQSVYNYNQPDSSDQQDYIQNSQGGDQVDSDFGASESYPGKRGRKKGSKIKKRGRGRGRPPLGGIRIECSPSEKVPGRKRGRPPKNRPSSDEPRPYIEQKIVVKRDPEEKPRGKRRGRPRKYPQPPEDPINQLCIFVCKKVPQQFFENGQENHNKEFMIRERPINASEEKEAKPIQVAIDGSIIMDIENHIPKAQIADILQDQPINNMDYLVNMNSSLNDEGI